MARLLRLESAALTAVVGAILLLPAVSDAQPIPASNTQGPIKKAKVEWYAPDPRTISVPFKLPAEPAIPSGCTTPTKAQCVDEAYWRTNACGSAPANDPRSKGMKAHCTWQMQKSWVASSVSARPTVFPTTNPTTPFPAMGSGRRVDHGKVLPFTCLLYTSRCV